MLIDRAGNSHARIPFVVHTFCAVLAAGARSFDSVSHHLATVVAFSYCWNCRSRSIGPGMGGGHASREVVERAIPNLKEK